MKAGLSRRRLLVRVSIPHPNSNIIRGLSVGGYSHPGLLLHKAPQAHLSGKEKGVKKGSLFLPLFSQTGSFHSGGGIPIDVGGVSRV